MKIIEADGKAILATHHINIPPSVWLDRMAESWPSGRPWTGAGWLKAQVLSGRRGKRGLVVRVSEQEAFDDALVRCREAIGAEESFGFLFEVDIPHTEEWLLAMEVDRARAGFRLTVSAVGGAEAAEAQRFEFDQIEQVLGRIPTALYDIVQKMFKLMKGEDILSIEINPLARSENGTWTALDAKIDLDEAALARHPGRALSTVVGNGITELKGDIAVMLFGGGASLIAMDALLHAGGRPANYVEASGNPDPEKIKELTHRILAKPGLSALWVAGSYANFTDIYETLRAVLAAYQTSGYAIPIVIRRDGPRADEAKTFALQWASVHSIPLIFHLSDVSIETSANEVVKLAYVS